jgi:hypothetical protein
MTALLLPGQWISMILVKGDGRPEGPEAKRQTAPLYWVLLKHVLIIHNETGSTSSNLNYW